MTELDSRDVAKVGGKVDAIPPPWPRWGGGWPNQAEAALIDAVLSIRARYGSRSTTGVRGAVNRYLEWSESGGDDLGHLAGLDCGELQLRIGKQKTSGNPKARAIIQAAGRLVDVGVRRAEDVNAASTAHKKAYTGVHGLGPVTWSYFTMLLGTPDIKADTWIVCFVDGALGRRPRSEEARQLLKRVAGERGGGETELDHAVWRHASGVGHRGLGCSCVTAGG